MLTRNLRLNSKKMIETPHFYHETSEPRVTINQEMTLSEIRQELDEVEFELQTGVQPLDGREVFGFLREKYGY